MGSSTVSTAKPGVCAASAAEEERLAKLMSTAPASLGQMFRDRAASTPDRLAYQAPGLVDEDETRGWTWSEALSVVDEYAAGLLTLGVKKGERIALACSTRIEWIFADLAILSSGAATTTIYPTTPTDDVAFIVSDSGSVIVFAEDASQVAKLESTADQIPDVRHIIVMDPTDVKLDGKHTISMDDLAERGREVLAKDAEAVAKRTAEVTETDLATLIYTSGTTGKPKGVRLPHRCWVYEANAVVAVDAIFADDEAFLWLPLSHSFGKVLEAGQIAIGHMNYVDGRVDKIAENLGKVRPMGMGGAPRIYEKIFGKVQVGLAEMGGAKPKIFAWAFGIGNAVSELREQGKSIPAGLKLKHKLADRLVFSQVRARMGNRVRSFISGSAPLNRDIARWFDAAGILILEGYGLTETSAASFVNRPARYKFGSVGMPLPGTSVSLDTDGEILIKGPGVMDGYHNLPEATAEVFTEDGWFRTGDIGEITEDGFLRITDRKKELIKTSGGKYVAPGALESTFKSVCPLASQIVIHGDGRNFVSALITLDPEAVETWAASNGMEGKSYEEIVTSEKMHDVIEKDVAEMNTRLARWETVKKFKILPADLTIEDGSLTPSLKLKRKVVEKRYSGLLDEMYS